MQTSTVFLNNFALLRKYYADEVPVAHLLNGLCLVVTFFVCRIVVGLPYCVKFVVELYGLHITGSVGAVTFYGLGTFVTGLNGLNIFWFSKLASGLLKKMGLLRTKDSQCSAVKVTGAHSAKEAKVSRANSKEL